MPSLSLPRIATRWSDFIAMAVVVLFGVIPFPDELFRVRGLLLLVALLPVAVMPFRRRWPVGALGVSLACNVVVSFAGALSPSTLIAVAITAFSVTDRTRRVAGIMYVAAATLVVFLVNSVPLGGELFDSRAMQFVMFIVLAGAMGDASRSRREYITAVTDRAERAEQGRDEEARRRVAEERVRIARDLHDLVAHQISVISLSAGVASSALETRPERAREALATIRSASRTVLVDIGGLMALLRAEDADELRGRRPQAGLGRLDDLVARFTDVGLHIELHRESVNIALSPANDHVAYLAVHEGLTNAHKHGAGNRTVVDIRTIGQDLCLTIANPLDAGDPAVAASGHGLRGLRERVAAVRGRVETSRVDGEFRLVVTVPVKQEEDR